MSIYSLGDIHAYLRTDLSRRQRFVQPKMCLKSESDSLYHIVRQVKNFTTFIAVHIDVNNDNPTRFSVKF